MIQGLRTVIYPVSDLGGFELGLIPDGVPGPQGAMAYWGVADAAAELVRLEGLKAEVHEPLQDVGGGIKKAEVKDPFGNVFGIIENPHFKMQDVR
jgi:predicted enzyme related to lactoylglutathione lyase